jgi:uncharacterized RDD family membrane protein YckC
VIAEGADPAQRVSPHRAQDVAQRVHGAPPPVDTPPRYVGLVTRAIAWVIDAAVVNGVAVLTGAAIVLALSVFSIAHTVRDALVAAGGVAFLIWALSYFVVFWATTGQTPGNRLMQIRVTHASGAILKPRQAIVRVIGLVLSILPLFAGFLPVLFNDRRRGLADWMANSVVVRAPPPAQASLNGHRPRGAP